MIDFYLSRYMYLYRNIFQKYSSYCFPWKSLSRYVLNWKGLIECCCSLRGSNVLPYPPLDSRFDSPGSYQLIVSALVITFIEQIIKNPFSFFIKDALVSRLLSSGSNWPAFNALSWRKILFINKKIPKIWFWQLQVCTISKYKLIT